MMNLPVSLMRKWLAWMLLATQAGCLVGPDFVAPTPPRVSQYTRDPVLLDRMSDPDMSQQLLMGENPPARWWQLFGSPELDAAVTQALTRNPTLQAAVSNLLLAEDNLRAGGAVFYPRLDANMMAERTRSASLVQGSSAPDKVFSVATLSGAVSYAIDLFGEKRRTLEQLEAMVDVQQQLHHAAYLTLTANVVNAYIARAGYLSQISLVRQIIALEELQLEAIQARVDTGVAPLADLLSQASLLAGNQALLAQLTQRLYQIEHLLAQLQGEFPEQASLPELVLADLHLPSDIPVSLPSALVRRRPDILAAEARMHAASAAIGMSSAAQYPSLELTATYGVAARNLSQLTGPATSLWSFGPSLSAPLFNGGRLRAQRDAAVNAFEASQSEYQQTVLTAFEQVADALRALQADGHIVSAQSAAARYAYDTLLLQRASYSAGLSSYADMLLYEVQYRSAAIASLQATVQRYQDTVALLVASGGGWLDTASQRR